MRANEFLREAEGEPEGVPHISRELIKHIIQQVGTEGAHAIVKSLQWGDGAAKELLQLIVKDLKNDIGIAESVKQRLDPKCWKGKHKKGTKIKGGVRVNNCVPNESVEEGVFDITYAHYQGQVIRPATPGMLQPDDAKLVTTDEGQQVYLWAARYGQRGNTILTYRPASVKEDWNKVNRHDKTDGLSQKAVNAYRREHPGSKLKTAVTKKPSELKAGSKDAKRRKSFCARMSGNKGPMKDEKGRPTPKAKALSRWNCE